MNKDYIRYFSFFEKDEQIDNAYFDKKRFIDLFYQFRMDNTSYPVSCNLFDQTRFVVDIANEMGRETFIKGFIEPSVTHICNTNIFAGDGFIDCGAHMGYYSMLASNAVGAHGHVFAFEPNPNILKICRANVGEKDNVTIHNLAISDTGNVVQLRMFGEELSPYNTLCEKARSIDVQPKNIIQVDSMLLQDAIYELRLKINSDNTIWIKLDIEGLELRVIHSAIDAIVNNKCHVIFEGSFEPDVNQLIFEMFKSRGYGVHLISDYSLQPINGQNVGSTTEATYYLARWYEE